MTANNITLTKSGTSVTVYSVEVEEIISKTIIKITPPQSSSNWGSGPKVSKIIDLLKIEEAFSVSGLIDTSSKANLKTIVKTGGVFTLSWEGEDFDVNLNGVLSIKTDDREDAHKEVKFVCLKGEDI